MVFRSKSHNLEIKGIFPSLILASDLKALFEGAWGFSGTAHCCDWLTCMHMK